MLSLMHTSRHSICAGLVLAATLAIGAATQERAAGTPPRTRRVSRTEADRSGKLRDRQHALQWRSRADPPPSERQYRRRAGAINKVIAMAAAGPQAEDGTVIIRDMAGRAIRPTSRPTGTCSRSSATQFQYYKNEGKTRCEVGGRLQRPVRLVRRTAPA